MLRLIAHRHVPKCTCGGTAEFIALQQRDSVDFLVGLNYSYSSVRSPILIHTPIPSLSKVISILMQDEGQREIQRFTTGC